MDKYLDFGLLAFTSLFSVINPLGLLPVYISMTSRLSAAEARKTAIKAVITAIIILSIFAFSGRFIFEFFQISVNGLKIVGGIIFLMIGYDMLQARLIRTRAVDESETEYASDIAITPLAIPMLCGPGAITFSIVLMNETEDIGQKMILLVAIIVVMLVALASLLSARRIIHFLGETGNKVMMRIMGLIVMVIAVEFFFSGLKPIIRDILDK